MLPPASWPRGLSAAAEELRTGLKRLGTRVHEKREVVNAANTPRFNSPNANVNGGNFLQMTSAIPDQRQFRLGLRMAW